MLEDLKSVIEITTVLVGIVISFLGIAANFRATGQFNLSKTLEAAKDAAEQLKILKAEGHLENVKDIGDKAVKMVEKIRGKKLKPTLARKAAHRALSLAGILHDDNKDSK